MNKESSIETRPQSRDQLERPLPGSLEEAQRELDTIPGVAVPPAVDLLRLLFEDAVYNPQAPSIVLSGSKSRNVVASEPISRISTAVSVQQDFISRTLGPETTFISTDLNQHEGMRTDFGAETETPSQMVAAALQAYNIQQALASRTENPEVVFAAHTILPSIYENSFLRRYRGDNYLLSGHSLIIAPHEGRYDHYEIEQLAEVVNPVILGVDPETKPCEIETAYDRLNPRNAVGKVAFSLSIGRHALRSTGLVLGMVDQFKNTSVMLIDPIAKNEFTAENGIKAARVADVVFEVKALGEAMRMKGMKVNGIHLRASGQRYGENPLLNPSEQTPERSADGSEPHLNNRQLVQVLQTFKDYRRGRHNK